MSQVNLIELSFKIDLNKIYSFTLDLESRTSTETSHNTNEIEVILKPHPKETNHNSRRFLKTAPIATGKKL